MAWLIGRHLKIDTQKELGSGSPYDIPRLPRTPINRRRPTRGPLSTAPGGRPRQPGTAAPYGRAAARGGGGAGRDTGRLLPPYRAAARSGALEADTRRARPSAASQPGIVEPAPVKGPTSRCCTASGAATRKRIGGTLDRAPRRPPPPTPGTPESDGPGSSAVGADARHNPTAPGPVPASLPVPGGRRTREAAPRVCSRSDQSR